MDAITLLKNDHQTVERLFTRLEGSTDDQERLELTREVVRELSIHAAIEEQFFYPAVRRAVAGGEGLVDEGLDEHQEVKEVLSDLDGMGPNDPQFDAKLRSLMQDVRHHVEEEESEILPKLAAAMSAGDLRELGERMQSGKDAAPTRPHPRAPNRPPGVVVAGAVAGVMDRARDAARDRLEERRSARKGGSKRPASKKSTAKPASKKSSAKKPAGKKTSAKKTSAKKTSAKKTSGRKSTGRKTTTSRKTTTGRKSSGRKSTAKTTSGRKSTGRKTTGRRSGTSRSGSRKSTSRSSR